MRVVHRRDFLMLCLMLLEDHRGLKDFRARFQDILAILELLVTVRLVILALVPLAILAILVPATLASRHKLKNQIWRI